MEDSFIDKYSSLNSPIHRLDPRVKILSTFSYIILVVLTPPGEFSKFFAYAFLIFILIFLSHIPFSYVVKRSFVVFPFVLVVAVTVPFYDKPLHKYDKLLLIWNVLIKSWLAVISMIVLTSTTRFPLLLKGFEGLKVPKLFIMLISFMYRYIFVLIDEAKRLERARDSRYFGGKIIRQIKAFANIVGVLFIKTYNRAERVYQSMISRGFDGSIKTINNLRFSMKDLAFSIIFLLVILIVGFIV